MITKWIKHEKPVQSDKCNFIIGAMGEKLNDQEVCEQLHCRQISKDLFEICCIPFYIYNISLGDIVEANDGLIVLRVFQSSGHFTFRVWFHNVEEDGTKAIVIHDILQIGCLFEWYGEYLLAIDAPNVRIAQLVSDYLLDKEQLGLIVYETGKQ